MDTLPIELLLKISTHLDSKSLYNWCQCCTRFNFSNILHHRIEIDWTCPPKIIQALLNALECHDDVLTNYIFTRIEALLYFESDALTPNMLIIYKDDVLQLEPNLTERFHQLEENTHRGYRPRKPPTRRLRLRR